MDRKFTHPRDAGPDHPGYVTRDGRPARIVCTDRLHARHPICALLKSAYGTEEYYSFTPDGRFDRGTSLHPLDLIDAPTPKKSGTYERWVIIGQNGAEYSFPTKTLWKEAFGADDLARFVVIHHWEEGEGL